MSTTSESELDDALNVKLIWHLLKTLARFKNLETPWPCENISKYSEKLIPETDTDVGPFLKQLSHFLKRILRNLLPLGKDRTTLLIF